MSVNVPFYIHNVDDDDIGKVADVLKSVFLTTGDVTAEFENHLEKYLGVNNAVGVMSCTAGLFLALKAWDIGPGDEVITTPMTFCATSNAIIHAGARPVFVDVESDTGNIDAGLIDRAVTSRTKAVIPVHLYGQMCDMTALREIADRRNLALIEDAAHCIEGTREGVRVGEKGDAACLSFYATKNITSGEGGAIVLNNGEKAELLKKLRLHGMDKSAADRYSKKYRHWDMSVLGYKSNLDNIKAALLLGQLARIDELWEKKNRIANRYIAGLKDIPGVELMGERPGTRHARHLFTVRVPEQIRDDVLGRLQERNIGVAVNYRAVHLLDFYRKTYGFKEGDFPNAERIGNETITLPLFAKMTDEQVEHVIQSVKEAVK